MVALHPELAANRGLVAAAALGLTVGMLPGLFYSMGAIVYALKRPNPSPHWFGFHEVFHAFTLLAFVTHYLAVSFVTYGAAIA